MASNTHADIPQHSEISLLHSFLSTLKLYDTRVDSGNALYSLANDLAQTFASVAVDMVVREVADVVNNTYDKQTPRMAILAQKNVLAKMELVRLVRTSSNRKSVELTQLHWVFSRLSISNEEMLCLNQMWQWLLPEVVLAQTSYNKLLEDIEESKEQSIRSEVSVKPMEHILGILVEFLGNRLFAHDESIVLAAALKFYVGPQTVSTKSGFQGVLDCLNTEQRLFVVLTLRILWASVLYLMVDFRRRDAPLVLAVDAAKELLVGLDGNHQITCNLHNVVETLFADSSHTVVMSTVAGFYIASDTCAGGAGPKQFITAKAQLSICSVGDVLEKCKGVTLNIRDIDDSVVKHVSNVQLESSCEPSYTIWARELSVFQLQSVAPQNTRSCILSFESLQHYLVSNEAQRCFVGMLQAHPKLSSSIVLDAPEEDINALLNGNSEAATLFEFCFRHPLNVGTAHFVKALAKFKPDIFKTGGKVSHVSDKHAVNENYSPGISSVSAVSIPEPTTETHGSVEDTHLPLQTNNLDGWLGSDSKLESLNSALNDANNTRSVEVGDNVTTSATDMNALATLMAASRLGNAPSRGRASSQPKPKPKRKRKRSNKNVVTSSTRCIGLDGWLQQTPNKTV